MTATETKFQYVKSADPKFDYDVVVNGETIGQVTKYRVNNSPYCQWYKYWMPTYEGRAIKGCASGTSTRQESAEELMRSPELGYPKSDFRMHDFGIHQVAHRGHA
jgi:hypothetical protein